MLLKYSLSLLSAIMVIGLTSCTDSYDYDPAAPEDKGAFLIANTTSFMFTPGQAQEFEITVQRRDTVEAGSVTLTSDNSKFNVPSQVSFGANEKTKTVTVTSNLESGSDENVNISVAEGQAYHYGANTITINVKTPKKYVGTFSSKFAEFAEFAEASWEQTVYELGNGKYMLPDLYDQGRNITFIIDWKTKKITVAGQAAWTHPNYGVIGVQGSGIYDDKNKVAKMTLTHFVPNVGSFGNFAEDFYFPEDFEPSK